MNLEVAPIWNMLQVLLILSYSFYYYWISLVAQTVKNQPAMKETQVHSLGQEDPLQKGITRNSSIFAWEIPWTEEAGRLQSTGHKESDKTEQLSVR